MSAAELLLTAGIACLVIPPKQWPTTAYHLAKALRLLTEAQQKMRAFWKAQIALYELQHNQQRAHDAATNNVPPRQLLREETNDTIK